VLGARLYSTGKLPKSILVFVKINVVSKKINHVRGIVFFQQRFWSAGSCLTKRAPDVWDSAAFSSIFLASSFSCSQAESTPAHTQVTQTVRQPKCKTKYLFDSQVSFLG
jgi:hypothetical protein